MLNIKTEMQNYIRRQTALNPEKDITMIDGRNRTEIYSVGDDNNLYLCYQADGLKAEFSRTLVHSNIKEFAATNIAKTNKVAIACSDEKNIYLVLTETPEKIEEKDFIRLNFDGVLGGKNLVPSNLLLSALDKGITLFVEMKDDSGRIEQFSCLLDSQNPGNTQYFPLAANFSDVKCSVAGRAVSQYVDGIYTYGTYGETSQLLYTPSCNVFGSTPPAPIRFKSEYTVDTICTLPLKTKTGTHLFSVGEGSLYLYPYDRQKDMFHISNPDPDLLISSDLFKEAKKVAAVRFGDMLYVYVLNEALVLSYTFAQCMGDKFGEFAEPVVLMENVFYFDISDQGTLNICKENSAIFGKRDSDSGEWGFKSASLETDLDEFTTNSAYVTRILTENPFDEVLIEFPNGKVSCFVNDICHNFQSMKVKADSLGAVTIAQIATSLTPPCMEITYKDEVSKVNPAEEAQKRLLSLTDENTLKNQVIYDPDGKTRNLFGEGADETGLSLVASSISALSSSVNSIMPGFVPMPVKFVNGVMVKITETLVDILPYDVTHNPFVDFIGKVVRDVAYAVSWVTDKIKWLYDHTIKKAVDFAIGLVGKVWKFVVKIGDKVLEVVVDTFEKVFSTAIKILEAIGIPISKIFDWLKKALGIDEACKMNDCLKKTMKLSAKKLAEITVETKDQFVDALDKVINTIADWSKVDLDSAKSILSDNSTMTLSSLGFGGGGPQGTYMFSTIMGALKPSDLVMPSFTPTQAMNDAKTAFESALQEFQQDINETASVLLSIGEDVIEIFKAGEINDVIDVLKRIVGKMGIAGIELCKSLIKPIFDLIACTVEALADLLCDPIHIPLLSEILKIFGINEFSIADVVTFPVSFLATTVSRIAQGKPLIDDAMYHSIMAANSIEELVAPPRINMLKVGKKGMLRATNTRACAEANEPTKTLFPASSRTTVVTLRFLLAAMCVADIVVDLPAKAATMADSNVAPKICSPISAVLCGINFGLSLWSGLLYSPMDSNDDSEYVKSLSTVKQWICYYSRLWYLKCAFGMLGGVCSAIGAFKNFAISDALGKMLVVNHSITCTVTAVFETIAASVASGVDIELGKAEYKDAEQDKSVLLCDASCYIIDDAKSVMDGAWDLGLGKLLAATEYGAPIYMGVREALAVGCLGTTIASAAMLCK